MNAGQQNSAETQALAGRIDALSAMVKGLLTTLVMRGLLTRADIPTLVKECEAVLGGNAAATAELHSIQSDLPSYLRAALGPPPDPDEDHDD
jgi:hypothetical protein